MKTILDKLGLYDLVAVLLSGTIITTTSLFVIENVFNISINTNLPINGTLLFFLGSYFLGMFFQELGVPKTEPQNNFLKFLYKIYIQVCGKLNIDLRPMLDRALDSSSSSSPSLRFIEKDKVFGYVKAKLSQPHADNRTIYEYCKYYIMKNCDSTETSKNQSLSVMSRSLSLYFGILAVITTIFLVTNKISLKLSNIILIFVFAIFCMLFYNRHIRYAKSRYINIFKTFYYDVIIKH